MSAKDTVLRYGAIGADDASVQVPNTVTRSIQVGERSFHGVVFETRKPMIDADLTLSSFVEAEAKRHQRRLQAPSGILMSGAHRDGLQDYVFDGVTADTFGLPRLDVSVAGFDVAVEYAGTATAGLNLVTLPAATTYTGPGAQQRTDFAFLEVWQALVAPSPRAQARIRIVDPTSLLSGPGSTVSVQGGTLTASATPGILDFVVDVASAEVTAANLAAKIDATFPLVSAKAFANTVVVKARARGAAGNLLAISATSNPNGSIEVEAIAGKLAGGADRPNKPATDQDKLYRQGCVQSPQATWLDDDLCDPIWDVESTQRVQLQWRIRTVGIDAAIDFKVHTDGFSVGGIEAQGATAAPVATYDFVPADGASTASALAYGFVDSGLWIAGDGSDQSAKDLGALDGFVYAIPLCFVFRYNDCSQGAFLGWDPDQNSNGAPPSSHTGYTGFSGVVPATKSDRPDGHFCDILTPHNVLDLRRHISLTGLDLSAELRQQADALLAGSLRTWAINTADKGTMGSGSGDVSTTPLVCNVIGRTDAPRGTRIRDFDHVARRFAAQPIIERVVIAFRPGDRPDAISQGVPVAPAMVNPGKYVVKPLDGGGLPYAPTNWFEGDKLVLDLSQLDVSMLGACFDAFSTDAVSGGHAFTAVAPAGTVILDVLGLWHDDGHYDTAVDQSVQVSMIQGLGTPKVEILLDTNRSQVTSGRDPLFQAPYDMVSYIGGSGGSPRRIFVELEIAYPAGQGLTDTPVELVSPDSAVWTGTGSDGKGPGPVYESDVAQRPADFEILLPPAFREGYREVCLEYVANKTTFVGSPFPGSPIEDTLVSRDRRSLYLPRRVHQDAATSVIETATAAVRTIDVGLTEWESSSRKVALDDLLAGAGQTLCDVTYYARDAIPSFGADGYKLSVYYRAVAPQTVGSKTGVLDSMADLVLQPLLWSDSVLSGQVGAGSIDLGFPWMRPLDQIPLVSSHNEWELVATADLSLPEATLNTGVITLKVSVAPDGQGNLTLGSPDMDPDMRARYATVGGLSEYRPVIVADPLAAPVLHKVACPLLAKVVSDVHGSSGGLLYRRNEVVLVLVTSQVLGAANIIQFEAPGPANHSCVAVYRTRNHLLLAE